jgi:hypothetical protein
LFAISNCFELTGFFSAFVRNLNFNNLIGLQVGLDEQCIPARQQALKVVGNSIEDFTIQTTSL